MQNFLQSLLSLTVGGSLLAVLVLLLGRVKKLPKSFLYYAWLLVLLRLAVPLPGNLALTVPQPMEPLLISDPMPVMAESSQWDQSLLDAVETQPLRPYLDVQETPDPIRPVYMNPKTMNIWDALGILWILGAAFCLTRDLGGYARFRWAVKKTFLPPRDSDLEIFAPLAGKRGPKLLRSPAIDSPMLMGVFRPVLLLPDREYDEAVLNCMFRHELTHFRRGDILLKWLAMPILAAHWFNPLTILIRRAFHQSCELSCDERLLKTMDYDQRKHYGQTLLVMAERGAPAKTALSTSFCAEKKHLKERLVHIMNFGPRSKWILAVTAVLLVAVIAACLALGPAREEVPGEGTASESAREKEEALSFQSLGLVEQPLTYSGETIYAKANLSASRDVWGDGIGLLLLLDGRPQPYKTEEGGELRYMHVFKNIVEGKNIDLIFEPVAGHGGEILDLALFTVKNPGRYIADPYVPFDHSSGSLVAMYNVDMKAEPGQPMVPDVRRREREVNIHFEDSTSNAYSFRFIPGARLDGKQKLQAKVSGPAGAEMHYVIYLNNQPVTWEYVCTPENQQQAVIDTTLDLTGFQGDGMIYAVLYGKNPNDPGDSFVEVSETFYLSVTGADRAIPGATVQTNVVRVSNVDEFLEAIGPDTTIVLKEGTYDLTTAKNYGKQHVSDYYSWEQVRDGYALTIRNVDNFAILGADRETCEIVTQPRYAPVLKFANCTDILIRALTAGHTQGVEGCSGAVFQVWGCIGFEVRNCDLYGCGTYGVDADSCTKLTVANSTIRDCSYGAARFVSCVDAYLCDNQIYGIGKPGEPEPGDTNNQPAIVPASLFQFQSSSSCAVLNNHITDSVAMKLLITDGSQQIYFMGNTGENLNMMDAVFASRDSAPTVDGCQLNFQNRPKWIDENYGNDYVYSVQGEKLYSRDLNGMKYRSYPMPSSEMLDGIRNTQSEQERLESALKLKDSQ